MKKNLNGKSGQAMTEYIIIVAVIALAALSIFALFGDRIRGITGGGIEALGGDTGDALDSTSLEYIKELDGND